MPANRSHWEILNSLDFCTLVCIGSRPGSDFIQSLFDGHPQILTLDGHVFFHEFYAKSLSVWGLSGHFKRHKQLPNISLKDFFYEFAYKYLEKFDPVYDNVDLKGELGDEKKLSNKIDIQKFSDHGIALLKDQPFTRKNALLAIYGAFALTRGDDLSTKKVLLHHLHHCEMLDPVIEDFPHAKILAATREQRAGYNSQIAGWDRYSPDFLDTPTNTYIWWRLLREGLPLIVYPHVDIRVNLLERLHKSPETVLKNMCQWLNIDYQSSLLESTWGGKSWWGDALSDGSKRNFNPNLEEESKKRWNKYLNISDQIILSTLLRNKMIQYGYDRKYTHPLWLIIVPFLILLPTKNECMMFFPSIRRQKLKGFLWWVIAVIKRYYLMYKKYFIVLFGKEPSFKVL